jgi:hypothetical protein
MTARAARKLCVKEGKKIRGDSVLGTLPQCSHGSCLCDVYQETLIKPGLLSRLWQSATFQKDTSAACVGCLQEADVCLKCDNRKARLKMEAAIEAMGVTRYG